MTGSGSDQTQSPLPGCSILYNVIQLQMSEIQIYLLQPDPMSLNPSPHISFPSAHFDGPENPRRGAIEQCVPAGTGATHIDAHDPCIRLHRINFIIHTYVDGIKLVGYLCGVSLVCCFVECRF